MGDKTLPPGMYLVGRHDGLIDPFFVRIRGEPDIFAEHYVDVRLLEKAWDDEASESWWWQPMGVPGSVPKTWTGYPESIKE